VFTVIAAGCSAEQGPAARRYSSGVSAGAQVSTLDDKQLEQICETYDVYVNTEVDLTQVAYIACMPVAVFTTLTPEDCQISLKNCMSLFPTPIKVSAKSDDKRLCAQTLKQCQAQVSDLEGCVNVNVSRALDVANIWSCDRVKDAAYREMAGKQSELVNVCSNVNDACNGFAAIETPD
jgi:hypothetical protein